MSLINWPQFWSEVDRRIRATIAGIGIDVATGSGRLEPGYLPPGGNTGSGYTPAPGSPHYEPAGAVAAHEAKADPHPQYTTSAEADSAAQAAVQAHAQAADPHPQYLTTAEGNALYAVPDPPDTIAYITDSDGAYLIDSDGRYLYEAA